MVHNEVIDTMMKRRSVRKYTDRQPDDEVIETIVRAGQQAPFAGQLCSVILTRKKRLPWGAPIMFTVCVDMHRMELIMAKRGWKTMTSDISLVLFGLQDAVLMAENMVIAAESLGLGSCFIGAAAYMADRLQKKYKLPERVYPFVHLVMGYPAEEFPPRPRYPLEFTLFEEQYPELTDEMVENAMQVMDEGYLAQDYYRNMKAKIRLVVERKETFTYDDYSWTEHISRKWGQWEADPKQLLDPMSKCGFVICKKRR
jgi:FMN reductase (NADPH)